MLGNNIERSDIGQLSGPKPWQLCLYATRNSAENVVKISKRMCSEIVQSENPHSFQEPASAPNSSDATRANPTVVFNTTTAQNSLNASEIATGFFMVQSLKMPPLTSTFPLKSSSNWTFELLKRVFEASVWHLLYSLCVRFLVIHYNFRSLSNAGNSFSEKGFTHILLSRFVNLLAV